MKNIQMEEARELNEKWKKEGQPQCVHANLAKEYHLGTATGDYVCTRCGTSGWGKDWNKN